MVSAGQTLSGRHGQPDSRTMNASCWLASSTVSVLYARSRPVPFGVEGRIMGYWTRDWASECPPEGPKVDVQFVRMAVR